MAAIGGTNGTGGIVKSGAGVLSLATPDTNTYEGATIVSNGTLLVNCASTNQGDYSVYATMGGAGAIGLASGKLLTINTGGTIAPGLASTIGALSVKGDVAIAGTYEAQIDSSNSVTTNDLLYVAGNLTLAAGSRLTVTMSGANRHSRCVLARYTGTLSGRFETYDLPAGFSIFYGTGNNSALAVGIPEGMLFMIQ
jgi:fibronectin-binding autotransporter adhesin